MSDLHLEHRSASERAAFFKRLDQQLKAEPVEVIVLAGDIGSIYYSKDLVAILVEFSKRYDHVLYVPGNHESFDTRISDVDALKLKINKLNSDKGFGGTIHLLQPGNRVLVRDKVFGGGTGWYPDCGDKFMKQQWIDYNRIEDCDPEAHAENKKFVDLNLTGGVDVMVSHMLPTEECVGARWITSWTNIFFTMGIDDALAKMKPEDMPKVWVFGHTHDGKNFISKYGFRAYCNPLGYPHENANPDFWNRIVVAV